MAEEMKVPPEVQREIKKLIDDGWLPPTIWVNLDHWVRNQPLLNDKGYVEYVRADTIKPRASK